MINMNETDGKLPTRKRTRLTHFDYSTTGAYFITICTRDRMKILSEITRENLTSTNITNGLQPVGEGLAPPATKLSKIGELVEEQMSDLEERYKNILIDEYVIMPDHIHMILLIKNTGGASPSPTMNDVICAFKSLTSRICKQRFGIENLFQRSFYDHVIRNQKDYETRKKYILENPIKWYYYQVYEDE